MNPSPTPRRHARILVATWVTLIGFTIGSFWVSDASAIAPGFTTAWLLAFAVVKSHLIAGIFMEMNRGPVAWAVLMSGFLLFEAALIGVILP
jgi:heme/copper-type cytochrome/quinol oxidase subunit 4